MYGTPTANNVPNVMSAWNREGKRMLKDVRLKVSELTYGEYPIKMKTITMKWSILWTPWQKHFQIIIWPAIKNTNN